eukprot:SAG22_NODE_1104_length_5557_cov_11.548369_4_plen_120_part_00
MRYLGPFPTTHQQAAQFFYDIKDYWHLIPLGAAFSLILSLVWITFLAKFAGLVIWGTVYGALRWLSGTNFLGQQPWTPAPAVSCRRLTGVCPGLASWGNNAGIELLLPPLGLLCFYKAG